MTSNAASFVGNIPHHYDGGLGPSSSSTMRPIWPDEWEPALCHMCWRLPPVLGLSLVNCVMSCPPTRLRDRPQPPMVEVARTKFQSSEKVDLRAADAMALPFPDDAFDAVVCQFGVMFFPDKAKSYQGSQSGARSQWALSVQRLGFAPLQSVRQDRS